MTEKQKTTLLKIGKALLWLPLYLFSALFWLFFLKGVLMALKNLGRGLY